MLSFDSSELMALAASFGRMDRKVGPALTPVVTRGAQHIKDGWASRASGIGHAPHYPRSISYDVLSWHRGAEAVIGPDKDRKQGALGNILEYGTSKNAPRADGAAALDEEEPNFLRALERAQGDVLGTP